MIFNSTGGNILVHASKHNDIIAIKDVGLDKQYLIWIKRYSRIQYFHDYLNKNEIVALNYILHKILWRKKTVAYSQGNEDAANKDGSNMPMCFF